MHDNDFTEPTLEVVEGDVVEPSTDTSIVPNAFETVLAKYDENHVPKAAEPEAPAYKNRAFIAAVCVIGGIVAGRLTTQPQIQTKVIEKDKPVLVASGYEPEKPAKVDKAFRELNDLNEFDPWQPMNGGFPLPPKETQARVVERSGPSGVPFNPAPPRMSGDILPMDPTEVAGPLPDINGKGNPFPENPTPGGKQSDGSAAKPTDPNGAVPATKPEGPGKERYVAMSLSGPEPSQGQSSLAGIASSAGGTARTFSHMSDDGTLEAQGVLLIIPASKYDSVKSKIDALGGASVDSNIEGNASSEQNRAQGMFITRLAKLRDKKKDLLVDFLDDAQPVKQISEAIDLETRAVSATRFPGGLSGKVVIRVLLK